VPVEGCDAVLLAAGFRGVELCTSKDVDRPSVIGFFSPRILIPEELFARLTTAEFGQIVLHEVGHLRRRDDWINLLQKLSLVLVPLNPVLLWVERRLCLERELACDEGVLRVTRAGKAYASCLARLAEHSMVRHGISLALGAWERQPELSRRVHRILHRPQSTLGAGRLRLLTTLLVMGLVACAAGLTRSPELLRFSASPGAEQAESASMSNMQTAGAPIRPLQVPRDVAGPARLVQASLQVARPRSRSHITAAHLRRRPTPALTQRPAPLEPWVLLTGWRQAPGMARPALALRTDFSYAAVPFGDGWLIFQL
ncbi:MAG TPA: M56 family metallopeptidase, partial [Acidobacteriaceae bacterium]